MMQDSTAKQVQIVCACVCVCVCIHALVSGSPAETGQRVRAEQDWRLPWWSSGLDSALLMRGPRFDPCSGN